MNNKKELMHEVKINGVSKMITERHYQLITMLNNINRIKKTQDAFHSFCINYDANGELVCNVIYNVATWDDSEPLITVIKELKDAFDYDDEALVNEELQKALAIADDEHFLNYSENELYDHFTMKQVKYF